MGIIDGTCEICDVVIRFWAGEPRRCAPHRHTATVQAAINNASAALKDGETLPRIAKGDGLPEVGDALATVEAILRGK